jgi:5'-3' exonuclease/transcription antitermination factor NusG
MASWVVLNLSPRAEGEAPEIIRASIRHYLRDAEVFLPASVTQSGTDRVVTWLLEGYVFVRRDYPDERYRRLNDTKYVEGPVIVSPGKLALVSDAEIDRFRAQIRAVEDQGIESGDMVDVTSGPYRNLRASVIADLGAEVQVHIKLRSKEALVTLPRSFLRLVEKVAPPPFVDRMTPLLRDVLRGSEILRAPLPQPELLRGAHARYEKFRRWFEKGTPLAQIFVALETDLPVRDLEQVYFHWSRLSDLADRLATLEREIDAVTPPLHALIDGHNLACRCATAPGLDKLTDKNGRSTGAIVGFLNSLTSWKKTWPEAHFTVVWDGSSRRRRALFPGYKASRGSLGVFREVTWLQKFLPDLGVTQAMHHAEEADDVLATLVAETEAPCLVISSDRDMLQLVSERVTVLVPGPTPLTFTPAKVQEVYGVTPAQMVSYRALAGDKSDEIPGVPGCGAKTAAKLIALYGSVDGVYRSTLGGVSKALYASLKASQGQVRLNLRLMELISTIALEVTPPQQDRAKVLGALDEIQMRHDRILQTFFQLPLF